MAELGQQIRRLREEKGWTQAELAVYAGMGGSGLSHIETGRRNPSAATLQKIAEALDVGVGDLYPKGQEPLPSPAVTEMEATLRAARENMALLRAYFDDPPGEETADEAIEDFFELTPRAMEILAGMERAELGEYAGKVAKLIREFAQISKGLDAWNEAQYGHLHRDVG
jgi:transcriptional regulator with XRE-family HTH domain